MAADRRLQLEGLLTELEFAAGRRQHQGELARVRQAIADASQADVLAPMIGDEASQDHREAAVREKWGRLGLDRRRAVVGALMSIVIEPAPRGRPRAGSRARAISTRGPSWSPGAGSAPGCARGLHGHAGGRCRIPGKTGTVRRT